MRKKEKRKPAAGRPNRVMKQGGQRLSFEQILPLLPLLGVMSILPLVVFLKITPVPAEYQDFWVTSEVFDFFSYYKSRILLACAGLVLLAGAWLALMGRLRWKKSLLFLPLAAYAILAIASTAASEHRAIALGGYFDRAEGMWVLLAYCLLMAGTFLFVSGIKQAWLLLGGWAVTLVLLCILGIFQFFGVDFFSSTAGRLLILPEQYHSLAPLLNFNFPSHYIYGTLYNPNNVASMMSLAFPLAATGFLFSRKRKRQVLFGSLAALTWLTLVGSKGQAGWLGVVAALGLVVAFLVREKTEGWWKRLGGLVMVMAIEFAILSLASGGILSWWDILPAVDKFPTAVSSQEQAPTATPGGGPAEGDEAAGEPGASLPTPEPIAIPPTDGESRAEQLIRIYGTALTGRGYIWIRSLEMADETILLGRGPDTFALYFPNTDPFKVYYGQTETFIDKPHNMYLQSWLNLGGGATLAFLAMVGLHAAGTIGLLRRVGLSGDAALLALGIFAGLCAYLLAGFFYDSAVSVSPVFWALFGLSMAANEILRREARV